MFYLHPKGCLGAPKFGACVCRLSFLGTLPWGEGLHWRTMQGTQAELPFSDAGSLTCTQQTLLKKDIFKNGGSKLNSLKNHQQDSVFFPLEAKFQINQNTLQQLSNFIGIVN